MWSEMYKVFNMGHRLEIYVPFEIAAEIISLAQKYDIQAQVVGRVEKSSENSLIISTAQGVFEYK